MNKEGIVNEILERTEYDFSKTAVKSLFNTFIDVMKDAINEEGKVTLIGFGTLEKVKRSKKAYTDFKTKKKKYAPARNTIVFKPGKEFKDLVN